MSKTGMWSVIAVLAVLALGAYWYVNQGQSISAPQTAVVTPGAQTTSPSATASVQAPVGNSSVSVDSAVSAITAGAASEGVAASAGNGTQAETQFNSTLDNQSTYAE